MSYTFGIMKIESFDKLVSSFNDPEAVNRREAAIFKSSKIFRVEGKPDEVAFLIEWANLDNARKFIESKELRETMQRSGVIETFERHYLEEV